MSFAPIISAQDCSSVFRYRVRAAAKSALRTTSPHAKPLPLKAGCQPNTPGVRQK